jgi:hypothetical protein
MLPKNKKHKKLIRVEGVQQEPAHRQPRQGLFFIVFNPGRRAPDAANQMG